MEIYENSLAILELYQRLAQAEAQINNRDENLDGGKVFKDLKIKYASE